MNIKASITNQLVRQIIKRCYPNYKGRKISISDNMPSRVSSYWDGGSRTYYKFYQPSTDKLIDVGSNHPWFESHKPSEFNKDLLPDSVVLVAHTIFCGKDLGITIYCKQPNLLQIEN